MSGNVYIVRASKFVKIGFAADVPRRLAQLQTGATEPLTLLAVIPGCTMKLEKILHVRLAEYRERGEWFRYTGKCRALVLTIIGGARPKTLADVEHLWEFAVGMGAARQAQQTIADPASTHEQLKEAHILLRHLTH
jgi:hypothetical protein